MKFNEKSEQIKRQSDLNKLFKSFEEDVRQLLSQQSQTVSFQLAYDHIFKLTKQGRQVDILNHLDKQLHDQLQHNLAKIKDISLEEIKTEIVRIGDVTQRLSQICLFLDINYCQKILKEPLMKRLTSIIFTTFTSDERALKEIASLAFTSRGQTNKHFDEVLELIDQIDVKKEFFEKFLIPHYIPLIGQSFGKEALKSWEQKSLGEYIEWCRSELEKQEKNVWQTLAKKRKREGVETVIACAYSTIVGAYKERIYQSQEKDLFEKMTLPILELFKFGKGKDIEGHIQWFMQVLEKKLNSISTEDNQKFIQDFYDLYEVVGVLLKGTQQKFQINYRSVFTFEEWINNQRFNIPLRLNVFIDHAFKKGQSSEKFTRQVSLLFKLVKEKNLFEIIYRRRLISRLTHSYLTYDLKQEKNLIKEMEKQCGQEWSQRISSISDLYYKDRDSLISARGITQCDTKNNLYLGGLVPVIVPQNAWPYEDRNSKIQINPRLMNLTSSFEKNYIKESQKHRLWWTSKAGTVLLEIAFKTLKRQFLMSVDMANLLLYVQQSGKKLNNFICEHGYSIDEIEKSLNMLIEKKLVLSEPQGNDYQVCLVDTYQEGSMVDFTKEETAKVQVQVMEELKADRKLMVEAILVKIMKGQKVCKRQQLLQKSSPLVAQRGFKFNSDFVEKSIDRLIDKQFIRDFQDGTVGYIA